MPTAGRVLRRARSPAGRRARERGRSRVSSAVVLDIDELDVALTVRAEFIAMRSEEPLDALSVLRLNLDYVRHRLLGGKELRCALGIYGADQNRWIDECRMGVEIKANASHAS